MSSTAIKLEIIQDKCEYIKEVKRIRIGAMKKLYSTVQLIRLLKVSCKQTLKQTRKDKQKGKKSKAQEKEQRKNELNKPKILILKLLGKVLDKVYFRYDNIISVSQKVTFETSLVIQEFLNYHPEPSNCKFSLPTILVFQMGGLEMVFPRK
jgi:hypothetical protein